MPQRMWPLIERKNSKKDNKQEKSDNMKTMHFYSKAWWQSLLLLLFFMFAMNNEVQAIVHFTDDGMMKVVHSPTISEPYIKVDVLYFDAASSDSYFISDEVHDSASVWVDDIFICKPKELTWNKDQKAANNFRDENDWTDNVYETDYATIRFFDPHHEASSGQAEHRYRIYMYIFLKAWEAGAQHSVCVKGTWRINDNKGTFEESMTVNTDPFTNPSWGGLSYKMNDHETISVSGNLSKSYGPTTVGLYTKSSTHPNGYTANCDVEQEYRIMKESFDKLTTTLEDWDYVSSITLPVQYSMNTKFTKDATEKKMTAYTQEMVVYKWYDLLVYGFARPKDVRCELSDQWSKKVKVSWQVEDKQKVDADSVALSTCGTWTIKNLTTNNVLASGISYDTHSSEVILEDYRTDYELGVYFVPKDETNLPEGLCSKAVTTITPNWQFTSFTAEENADGKIDLVWKHNAINDASSTKQYTLFIQRRTSPDKEWENIATQSIATNDTIRGTYTDGYELVSNQTYYYRLKVNIFGEDQISSEAFTTIGGSKITSLTASRGTYSTMVKLQWNVLQVGTNVTNFTVQRRPLGSSGDSGWVNIYSTSGTASTYSYDDVTALPGSYNEYRVLAWSMNGDVRTEDSFMKADGFSMTTGSISGNLTYGTGTAVSGAKVTLKQQTTDGDISSGLRSVKMSSFGTGFRYECNQEALKELFGENFSVQMYVNPDSSVMNNDTKLYQLMDVYNSFGLYLHYDKNQNQYLLGVSLNKQNYDSHLIIKPGTWTQINCVHSKSNHQTVVCLMDGNVVKCDTVISGKELAEVKIPQIDKEANCLSIGNNSMFNSEAYFSGYLDEFRFWTKNLTEDDILKNYNHPLAGSEQALAIYYPFDEGLKNQTMAYDMSKKNGIVNGRHASAAVGASSSTYLPSEDQMSLMAYTDNDGYYEIRGVPFSGEGTSYTIVPTLGIHEFSPSTRSRYVSMSSLNHSGVDFEDVSSFPVSGKVFYAGTDYPVEGASLTIDGIVCSKDGEIIHTNEKGEFTISVPIGDHFVSVELNGHEFADNGRYPADPNGVGLRHTFNQEIKNLEFYDETLVNFTGRVVGGDIEGGKDLGFGLSQNNIGIAELVLTPLNETPRLNVVKEEKETSYSYETNTKTVPVVSATDKINSKSWRGAGSEDCRKIIIHTDSLTGEFSAMVPPLQYKVDNVKVVNTGLQVGASTTVDLSNPLLERSDSLRQDSSITESYSYNTKLMLTYHSDPVFNVKQEDHKDGAFGISSYKIEDEQGTINIEDIYSIVDGKPVYKYGGAIFEMNENYTFNIEAYEEYVNSDSDTPITFNVPLQGLVVTVDNALSSDQGVYPQDISVEGENHKAGEVAELLSNQLRLDTLGCATYKWMAGLPNISTPYTRTISISYDIDGRTYLWNESGLTGIILGDLPTGNNFVTAGPDKLDMILRDPPGSKSTAEWTSGRVGNAVECPQLTVNSDAHVNVTTKLGTSLKTGEGMGFVMINSVDSKLDIETGIMGKMEFEGGGKWTWTRETTKAISTSDAIEYVGAPGDLFIGSATNVIFGAANNVGFHRVGSSNEVKLDVQESISTGLSFGTSFCYTQNYIENMLLPNLELMRNTMLTTVTQDKLDSYVNNGKYPVYLTTRAPGDPGYGEMNWTTNNKGEKVPCTSGESYTMFAPVNSTESFQDSVMWCNNQMDAWIQYLRENEKSKVEAFKDGGGENYSFTSGSSVSYSHESDDSYGAQFTIQLAQGLKLNLTTGATINDIGLITDMGLEFYAGVKNELSAEITDKTTFKYTLAEDGDDNAISVDVYDYDAFGPIFRTRGGQTSAPYEGKEVTKYYEPGTTIMEATMQIEVPQIDVDQPVVTDIPSGSTATYTLRLSNASETNELLYYRLGLAEETNPNGAMLFIDGTPVTDVRTILIQPHETVTKTLLLKQSDQSILDYDRIGIVFASSSQYYPTYTWDVIADTAFISAHYVPSSSPVSLELSSTLMNTQTGTDLVLTMKDFDRNYRGLKAFRMQYKKQGATGWTQIQEYVLNEADKTQNNELLPSSGASVSYTLPMSSFSDGDYLFRVVSASAYGASEVTRYSDEVALVKDMQRPTPIGIPEPADGILNIGDELSVTFNEAILKGELTNEANFKVTGVLNGAEVDHETALSMTATEAAAATDADINLAGKDFAFDMWVNLTQGARTLLSHGNGASKLTIGTDASNKLVVTIGGTSYNSTTAIPANKWSFLSLSLTADGKLNAAVAYDDNQSTLFNGKNVGAYSGQGPIALGGGASAALHELLLWDEAHDMTTALLNRGKTKNPSTRHLIGYWKMNEGEGTTIRDYARNRHMTMSDETWYLNNENKAVSLNGQTYVNIDASELPTCVDDDYAVEFWMRGAAQTGEAQLLQMGDIALWLTADGTLTFTSKEAYNKGQRAYDQTTNATNLTDNAWHHIAVNVLRQGTAAIYVDGRRCLTTNSSNVGSITTNNLIVGARRSTISAENAEYAFDRAFNGQVDEVRVWNATMNGDLLTSNRKVRLTGSEDGLVAYYPFEKKTLDSGNQVVTVGDAADLAGSGKTAQLSTFNSTPATMNYTDEAPALRTKPTETNVSFSFVASNEKVVINLDEDAAILEGCTLNFTVRDVRDENGNYSVPAVWTAFVNKKELEWLEDEISLTQEVKTGGAFDATIINKSGVQQMWSLSGMPSWLSVSEDYGTTNPQDETTVAFTVSPSTPIGKYEETIYLRANNGIETPLIIHVNVTGQVPDWSVNPGDYENSMNVIGRVEVQGLPMDDADDLVAAFIGEECRGVAHPAYIERYDSYFVTMNIYGNDDVGKKVTFRAYDASTGTLYPELTPDTITFAALKLTGRYEKPIVFTALDKIEQSTELKEGWNWMSLFVKADDMDAKSILSKVADDVLVIKSQADGWLMRENDSWSGKLTSLKNNQMYAVQMQSDRTLRIVGQPVDPANCPINLASGWNWVGYYGHQVASVSDAFAAMSPEDGDIVKGQSGVTYFDSYEWAGPLMVMEPGVGYMVHTTTARQFGYSKNLLKAPSVSVTEYPQNTFSPVDYHNYSNNAIMTVRVINSGKPVAHLELGVFVDNECRTADVTDENGIAFLTIPGDHIGTMSFKLAVGDEIVEAAESFTYEADAIYGSPSNPVVLELGNATGIGTIDNSQITMDSYYDLSGRKFVKPSTRQMSKGIYIINGQKQVVK